MTNELIKEKIVLTQNIGKESTQILVEGDIIVPDAKPDMEYILKTDSDLDIDRTEVSQDRVNFSGRLNLKVLYLAKGSDKPIHSISSTANIDDFINMQDVNKDMWVQLRNNITNIDYRMLNDRKISYRAVIDINVEAEAKTNHDVVSNITELPNEQIKKRMLEMNKTVENKNDRFIVKDELLLPAGKPNIREILQTSVSINNKEVKVSSGRVHINGELVLSTIYKGDDDESVIDFVEHEIPFNGFIDVSAAKEGMFADVTLKPNEQYIQVRPDADGEDRALEVEVSVATILKLTEETEVEVLEDAYIVDQNLGLKKELVKYPKLICRNKNQCPVKEIMELDKDCPDIFQIFKVTGKVQMDSMSIEDDRVIVEGAIDADIMYIAKNDDLPIYNFKTVLPFKQTIETKGSKKGMESYVENSIDHVGFNMLSEREMEVRFLISFNTKVVDANETEIITDIEFSEIDSSITELMPSIIIYVVQPGDSLWSIAKKYNCALEDLIEINDIENPNVIYPNQKLIILKRVRK